MTRVQKACLNVILLQIDQLNGEICETVIRTAHAESCPMVQLKLIILFLITVWSILFLITVWSAAIW